MRSPDCTETDRFVYVVHRVGPAALEIRICLSTEIPEKNVQPDGGGEKLIVCRTCLPEGVRVEDIVLTAGFREQVEVRRPPECRFGAPKEKLPTAV